MAQNKVTSGRKARKLSQLSPRLKWVFAIGIIAIISVSGLIGYFLYSYITAQAQAPSQTLSASTVNIYDWTSGENLEELCPISILGNKVDIEDPNEAYDETNYESVVTEKYPEDISVDLSEYEYVIFRLNPDEATDGYWTLSDSVRKISGVNQAFDFYACHESTDIYGNLLETASGTVWDGSDSNNISVFLWFPDTTTTEYHWESGGKWQYNDPWDELSTATIAKLQNEKYWRCQPTNFDLSDDQADHERTGDYLTITETSAIKLDFNDTIGASTSVTGLNITVDCDIDFLVEYGAGSDNDKLFIVFTETWDIYNGVFNFNFEIELGTNLTLSNAYAGRITIPGRTFNDVAPTFTSLQTLV